MRRHGVVAQLKNTGNWPRVDALSYMRSKYSVVNRDSLLFPDSLTTDGMQ